MMRDTRSTREADEKRSMVNAKPYRNKAQKAEARRRAEKIDGRWVSDASVSYHPGGDRERD